MTAIAFVRSKPERGQPRRRREIDWSLVAGALFFGALILLAIYGPLIAPHDIYYSRSLVDGKAPPFPPSPDYALGSDGIGRDRLSWLLVGARGTVVIAFAAAALRVILGASLGLVAGFHGGALGGVLRRLALGLSSVPATIATVLAVIALNLRPDGFVLALGLVGWAEPFHQARRYARSEGARPFMESARSLGFSDRRLLFRHLLPNIAPALLTTAAFQVAAVLLLMAELALLNVFVGGAVIVDYDSRGNAIVAPMIPNWASMLATTRPVVSLYGDLAAVLLPGGALLGAVLATNLFGDALAARAQRLDVYRLFSRRQLFALAGLAVMIAFTVGAWPSRLAAETDYARGFDAGRAEQLAQDLATLGPRTSGSAEAESASALLAQELNGQVVRATDAAKVVTESELRIGGLGLPAGAVTVLSIDDADLSGPLVYIDVTSLFGQTPAQVSGAIVVLDRLSPGILGNVAQRLVAADARAVVALDTIPQNYLRGSGLYPLPAVQMPTAALTVFLHRSLPDLQTQHSRSVTLADEATLHVRTVSRETLIANVVTHVGVSLESRPLVLITASYDSAPGVNTRWDSATAAAVLVAVVDRLRIAPLDLEVEAVATSADFQNWAGLRLALAQLDRADRGRLQAVVLIGPSLSDTLVVETQTDIGMPSGTGRLAARLQDALGVTTSPRPAGDLLRAIQSTRVAAPPIRFAAAGPDSDPLPEAIQKAGRAVLTALAYIPNHISEMR